MSEPKSPGSVQVIDRTFKILETIARNGNVSLKDIYTTLGLNKASTLRIVTALCSNGYVCRDPVGGNYSLTFKAFEVGVYAVRNVNYISFIKSFLEQMSSDLGVIAQFSVEDNNELLCLESYDPTGSSFSVYTRVGQRSPLYSTSAGKAILSTTAGAIPEAVTGENGILVAPGDIPGLAKGMLRLSGDVALLRAAAARAGRDERPSGDALVWTCRSTEKSVIYEASS